MKTILFDLDGTLVDSAGDIAASINHVRRLLYGLGPLQIEEVAAILDGEERSIPHRLYGVAAYEPKAREIFEEHYTRQCRRNARVFEGVREAIEALKGAGCELYVCTNAPTATSREVLRNNNILHHFADVIGADRVPRPKPAPDALLQVRQRARFPQMWMVGDSAKDMDAARRAGIPSVFVTWGYSARAPREVGAHRVAARPGELAAILLHPDHPKPPKENDDQP